MDRKRLFVFDLDGTLISVNSFPLWIKFLLRRSLFRSPILFLKIILILIRRILGFSDRIIMKKDVIRLHYLISEEMTDHFAEHLVKQLNKEVWSHFKRLLSNEDADVILSTAAPENYVKVFAKKIGIKNYIATSLDVDDGWLENFGDQKWTLLNEKYNENEYFIDGFYTDDYHDLPLMMHAKYVYLVNPSQYSIDLTKKAGILIKGILRAVSTTLKENL